MLNISCDPSEFYFDVVDNFMFVIDIRCTLYLLTVCVSSRLNISFCEVNMIRYFFASRHITSYIVYYINHHSYYIDMVNFHL